MGEESQRSRVAMEPCRLRLKFDDSVLTDSQKSDGLACSWALVQPGHRTISDFLTSILHSFDLRDSCPNGIVLSEEGFVLPHFESIEILRDADLVCVKRKESKLLLEQEADEKLPFSLGMPGLATGDIENGLEGNQNESETEDEDAQTDLLDTENVMNGDTSIKKGKSSKQLKNSKKRKCKEYNLSPQKEHPDSSLQNGYSHKKSQNSKQDQVHNQGCSNINDWEGVVSLSSEPDQTVRVSASRGTRRNNTKKKRLQVAEQLHKKKSQKDQDGAKILDQHSASGDELTPVLVRPGHIRFTTPEKEKDVQQYQGAVESMNWRGITNNLNLKKQEKDKQSPSNQKQPAPKCNDCRANQVKQKNSIWNENRSPQNKQYASPWGGNRSNGEGKSGVKWNEYRNRARNWTAKKAPPTDPSKEYEKLVPLTDFPLEGDIIAYRLLDISSSSCPVMTSYRVGKVLSCDPKTNRVVLVPVPEYPFEFKKASDDTSSEPADASRYKEDGTLEIDFPSLADVRVVKRGPSAFGWISNPGSGWGTETRKWAPGWGSTSDSDWCTETAGSSGTNMALASTSENGGRDVWEEIIAAVDAKKAEEAKEDSWSKKRKRANYTWITRTVRRQAYGADMTAQNGNGGGQA